MSGPNGVVLNVDDYAPARYARTKVLRQAGFEVLEAASGQETVDICRSAWPHLVLLDIDLPDMSGYEVCRILKSDVATRPIQVLHLTAAFRQGRDHALALDLGADGFLVEPVEPEVLLATVRALIRTRRAEEAVREAATEWQATFDAISDGVCLLDLDGRIRRCNAVFVDLLGGQEVLGEHWLKAVGDRVASDDRDKLVTGLTRPGRTTLEIATGDRDLHVSLDPLIDAAGTHRGRVCIVRDVSERKRIEHIKTDLLAMERQARAEAEEANRAKDEFLAVLSHELRTPLTAMLGWVRLLRGGRLEPGAAGNALEVIERNVRLQAQLVEDLLDVSRIVSGKLRIEARPVSVAGIVRAGVEAIATAAAARGVALEAACPASVGFVLGDPARLEQVLVNLLSNAVKFTPAGGRASITVERASDRVCIAVRDTGAGIDAALLPHVFERFRQAQGADHRSHSGLGLGLTIVRHLVELHGGTVRAESQGAGQGAAFTVELPVFETPGLVSSGEAGPESAPAAALERVRVLLVEDNDDTRGMLTAALRGGGAEVEAARSMEAALEALAAYRPDVVVSDIGMPGGDGYDLIRSIRRSGAEPGVHTPAIALTAFAAQGDIDRALAAGYDRHLAKPVEPALLVSTIAELVRRR
jgi:PAS domain S-box-containing protein